MIKQTQTKMFQSSDVGLDFCAGSINKFPEVFKKMLATGFNEQTVNSVAISGSQITLTYGVTHGYVQDRVLQVTASGGFNKEVYIDSVSGNDVVCTVIDGVTTGLTGTITTKVASLGWSIVYEVGNVHVYKMKHFDDTDMYVRMCFQNNTAQRNGVSVCIGKTYDNATGFITDVNSLEHTRNTTTPFAPNDTNWWVAWNAFYSGYADATYTSGYSQFGLPMVFVGSPYHLGFSMAERSGHNIFGIFPKVTHDYAELDYPVLVSQWTLRDISPNSGNFARSSLSACAIYIGKQRFRFSMTRDVNSIATDYSDTTGSAVSSFIPSALDTFNTTTLQPLALYEYSTGQHFGYMYGLYLCMYDSSNRPYFDKFTTPLISYDVDFNNIVAVVGSAAETHYPDYVAFVVEKIKHGV